MRLFGVFFTIFPLLFISIGSYLAWEQQHKLETFVPVQAKVLSKRVSSRTSSSSNGGSSTTYTPHVEYEYTVAGIGYTCDTVTVQSLSSSRGWARSVVGRFEVGQIVEVYHNPADPADAFLLREAMFFPYIFILFPMLFVCVGVGIQLSAKDREPGKPTRDRSGNFVLTPIPSMVERMRTRRLFTLLWWGVGVAACGHFLWINHGSVDTLSLVVAPIYFGVGLVPLVLFWRSRRTAAHVGEGVVTLDREAYEPGDEVAIELSQPTKRDVVLDRVEIALIGEKTTRYSSGGKTRTRTDTFHEDAVVVAEVTSVSMMKSIRGEATLRVPDDAMATTDGKGYPRVRWSVRVSTEIAGCPRYVATFPFVVAARREPRRNDRPSAAQPRGAAVH